jgi:tetratricopeptide (TPR) repeat protein
MPDESPKGTFADTEAATPIEPTLPTTDTAVPDAAALPVVTPESYAIEGEVARGGMGRILLARDRRLRRPVAIKELHTDLTPGVRRFVREALVTARLQHPAIVPVYEAGRWPDGVPFYAMKMVQGRALDALIRGTRTLGERLALLPHVIAVAEAMAYAHSERIIHRDLKPGNVLVGPFGETVVVDWGLAKDLASPTEDEPSPASLASPRADDKTVLGTVMGTPHYMPPEQARGEAVDERADVYALGAILYYMLTGAPPHAGKTAAETLAAARNESPDPVEALEPEVPQELAAIVHKSMAMRPADRYPSAREMAADLKRFETGQLVSVHRYSAWDLLKRWMKRHRAAVGVAAVLTAALAASVAAGVVGTRRQARRAEAERDRARVEARKAEQIATFVQGMLSSADPRVEGRTVTVADVLGAAARRAETELSGQAEVQAAVEATIGAAYDSLGLFEPAERHLRAALEMRRRVLGPEHADVAESLVALASHMRGRGDLASAEGLLREAVGLYGRLGLAGSLPGVMARSELASVLDQLGQGDEGERLHRETLAAKRRLLGSEHHLVAESLNNLAVVVGQKGNWEEAETLHRESLEIMKKVHGPEHPEVAAAMSTLASVLEARGRLSESEALFRASLDMRKRLLGAEHPDVAWTLYNYSWVRRRLGDHEGAARLAREALAMRGKTLPDSHPMIAASLQVLALSLIDLGSADEALPLLRESLALRRRNLPPGHWLIATSESALGACLTALGRHREAEPILLGSYESLRGAKGEGHERTVEARQRLVALYEAWGKPARAAAYRSAPTAP